MHLNVDVNKIEKPGKMCPVSDFVSTCYTNSLNVPLILKTSFSGTLSNQLIMNLWLCKHQCFKFLNIH